MGTELEPRHRRRLMAALPPLQRKRTDGGCLCQRSALVWLRVWTKLPFRNVGKTRKPNMENCNTILEGASKKEQR